MYRAAAVVLAASNNIGVSNMLTDRELLAAVHISGALNDPTVRELARRFAADVAAMDADEAAWLEQPQPVSLDTTPRPVA